MSGCIWHFDACRDARVPIESIHMGRMVVVMAGGMEYPIVSWYDEFGEPTENEDEAVKVEFGTPEDGYITCVLAPPEDQPTEH